VLKVESKGTSVLLQAPGVSDAAQLGEKDCIECPNI